MLQIRRDGPGINLMKLIAWRHIHALMGDMAYERMRTLIAIVAVVQFGASATQVYAQTYPTKKPIRFLVGFAPGGANDIVARVLGSTLGELLGQQVIVDNRPGANGIVANAIAADSTPDGYTMLIIPASFSFDSSLRRKLPYDPASQFAPVALVASAPLIFLTRPGFPAKNIQELVALAKAKPGQLNYAHGGVGNITQLIMELLKLSADISITPIAYSGAGPGLIALMAGDVDVQSTAILSGITQIKAGKVHALAVTSAKRSSILPEVPTVSESGFPDYVAPGWWGVLLPARTPDAVIKTLSEAINRALLSSDVRGKLAQLGTDPVGGSPREFSAHLASEAAKWSKVVRSANIRME